MDGKLMAGNTPKQRYPDPYTRMHGDVGGSVMIEDPNSLYPIYDPQGAMANTPHPGWGYPADMRATTPSANPAAVRAYTRNAPYLQEFMSDPQTMLSEMYNLQEQLKEKPDDIVSQYRLRILRQAMGDVFGMKAPEQIYGYGASRAQAPVTPSDIDAGYVTTPRSPPTMPQTMARRGR